MHSLASPGCWPDAWLFHLLAIVLQIAYPSTNVIVLWFFLVNWEGKIVFPISWTYRYGIQVTLNIQIQKSYLFTGKKRTYFQYEIKIIILQRKLSYLKFSWASGTSLHQFNRQGVTLVFLGIETHDRHLLFFN
jgi:hypothetical protein